MSTEIKEVSNRRRFHTLYMLLGLSRNFGYELARRGEIPIVKFGKRKLVPKAAFERMLGKHQESEVNNQ